MRPFATHTFATPPHPLNMNRGNLMSLNATPSAERLHIGFFGVRNAGKSSVVNTVTNQDLSIVSDTKGTTTDPVKKAMEILPLGPVVIIDTPGIDDEGDLGTQRVQKAKKALRTCDLAVLVVDATRGLQPADEDLIQAFEVRKVPYVIAYNKADLLDGQQRAARTLASNEIFVSAQTGEGIYELKDLLGMQAEKAAKDKRLVADLLQENDLVVLVIPIDSSAPKGRIILPQQMVLRDALDSHAICLCCQTENLQATLDSCARKPRIVITDSQAFERVAQIVPDDIELTSFSILMARYKGNLEDYAAGAARLRKLTNADSVLIGEGCTHHRQCDDIGTVKIPGWIKKFTGAEPHFEFSSGTGFPDDLDGFDLVIHCGGCMLNDREMRYRVATARGAGVPIVNYGIAIAEMHGILERALRPFPEAQKAFKGL